MWFIFPSGCDTLSHAAAPSAAAPPADFTARTGNTPPTPPAEISKSELLYSLIIVALPSPALKDYLCLFAQKQMFLLAE